MYEKEEEPQHGLTPLRGAGDKYLSSDEGNQVSRFINLYIRVKDYVDEHISPRS